jgi:hypothetical protein
VNLCCQIDTLNNEKLRLSPQLIVFGKAKSGGSRND